jgi:hypothetical protein
VAALVDFDSSVRHYELVESVGASHYSEGI